MAAAMPAGLADLSLTAVIHQQLARLTSGGGLLVVVHRDAEERCQLMDLLLAEVDTSGKSVMLLGEGLGHGVKRFPRIPCRDVPHGEAHSLVMAALEHDPDILAIEDATESQTFIAASKASMRGKLVMAGLSLNDLSSAVRHLLYFWHKHYVIPTYIKGIVSCRRVAMLCPSCRISHELSTEESMALGTSLPTGSYCRPVGCQECDQSGHIGSRYLLDVVPFEQDIIEVFETSTDGREVIDFLSTLGYRGSSEEGTELLRTGDISPEEYVTSILL
jgi:type IV pilus assembly protein PilB